MADTITAKILRYDPSQDAVPEFVSYEVPWEEDESGFMTGLQVLHAINETQDAIGYDFCCRSNLCGRCSMLIDGEACLSCFKALQPGEHTFEPLPGFPVIRDLMVDHDRAYQKILNAIPQTQTIEPIRELKNIDQDLWWNTLERINMCRECMCCYSQCQALNMFDRWDTYAGPAAMMVIAHHWLDTRDQSDRIMQAVFQGLFQCVQCGNCTNVCSSHIEVRELILQMQEEAESRGLKPASEA